MARYNDASCRLCRREGDALFLKGTRCYSDKCAFKRRAQIPGQHGKDRMMRKQTGYEVQLRAKQKVRRIYGILERQFENYYNTASAMPGNTGTNLLHLLESRLDNVVYRMGFGLSRSQARMWVTQGHFAVNGQKVDIPSYRVQPGDTIEVRENSKLRKQLKELMEKTSGREQHTWLEVDRDAMKGKFLALPDRSLLDQKIQESLIVEYYSR
ncbi:MAG: SSU ribosomal protein S4p (S9e) [Candidatus Ozemobacter sibiricus]|uniref:Small ribosomal subunit protein uS4 n=1 Tax=Candidatus Ozemobacter sibiricus TaxID=2268124 RepID=A0A367ZK58_9BACT|nr:MAG: SSU ribosomal protein S4p (S9e) [Candidatus Ozemobacter sibiricus]